MAEKGFGVKEINLIGASGTPTIESPNNLNLNAINVAISTNVSIGGTLSVSGNISVGGTLTYEDVTNIDSVGIITARSGVQVTGGELRVGNNIRLGNAGVVTATSFIGDGSGLTGVTASGTGVLIKNSGSNVGTAGTINFGNNLSVGALSAGAVTVDATQADPANNDVQVAYTVSGSGVYNFTGNGVDSSVNYPELYMYRDTKYRFIHNAGGSHPIAIFTAQSGGSKYEDGVTYSDTSNKYTTQGNNLDFTPQHDAPDTLWYRCVSHSYMVGKLIL